MSDYIYRLILNSCLYTVTAICMVLYGSVSVRARRLSLSVIYVLITPERV